MNILLTGSSGFLGKVLHSNFLNNHYNVITLSRSKQNNIIADLEVGSPIFDKPMDLVVHAAGKAHVVPKSEREKQEFYKVNFTGTRNLCNGIVSSSIQPKTFIFISTVAVYGLEEGQFIDETYSLKGSTPYAKSKIHAEEWLQDWAIKNNITLGILRLPLIFGPNPPGNLGAMIKGISSGKYMGIDKSQARKSAVWAEDIANIIPKVAKVGGIYNLTDGYHPSLKELEQGIAIALGKTQPKHIPVQVAKCIALFGNLLGSLSPLNTSKLNKLMSTLTFDDSKAKGILNWQPSSVLDKLPLML